ncbi:MAG: hypothetical protein DRG78_00425 [Epsilonproteobacteria bacterium]|nr:MAG: hypothetical protein DRG78_00425 [Campylobacterota bacterium]
MVNIEELYYSMMVNSEYNVLNYQDKESFVYVNISDIPCHLNRHNTTDYISILKSEVEGIKDLKIDQKKITLSLQTEAVLTQLKLIFS